MGAAFGVARVLPIRAASRTSATSHGLFGKRRAGSVAARIASRVLPTQPGPTRLIRWPEVSLFLSSAGSLRRPIKLIASAGRLPDLRLGLTLSKRKLLLSEVIGAPTT